MEYCEFLIPYLEYLKNIQNTTSIFISYFYQTCNMSGFEYRWIAIWLNGKVESFLVSVITDMPILTCIINFKLSDLLDMELILRLPMTDQWLFLSFRFPKHWIRSTFLS